MPGKVNTKLIWENNSDTAINASNLSRSLDFVSDSKFIEYTVNENDYKSWADIVFTNLPQYDSSYNNKYVYATNTHVFAYGDISNQILDTNIITPIKKLLKIKANTRISMSYIAIAENTIKYQNFDVGPEGAVFSIESLIIEEDFSPNSIYNIYLYNTSTLGDFAQFKIVSELDDNSNIGGWKQGSVDIGSPTGSAVIAIRKIGSFKTNLLGEIDANSLWDISIYQKEVITEKYKIINSNGVKDFSAIDIPVNLTGFSNVQNGLEDLSRTTGQLNNDMYNTAERYGFDLEFSQFYKPNFPIDFNANSSRLPLRITTGHINVSGKRIVINNPIYLGDTDLNFKINNFPAKRNNIQLGPRPQNPYANTNNENFGAIYPGIWRVYINTSGEIIFKEGDSYVPKYVYDTTRKGWYLGNESLRCIGKFIVKSDPNFYVEKMSITNTFDIPARKNSIHIFHGTLCPDGLFLCDGKWHDINNSTEATYTNMPNVNGTLWNNSWWEQTPNMYGRGIKMFNEDGFSPISGTTTKSIDQPMFLWAAIPNSEFVTVISGSSNNCGEELGSITHNHTIIHSHNMANTNNTIRIISSGEHEHDIINFNTQEDDVNQAPGATPELGGGQNLFSTNLHKHTGRISTSGSHGHNYDEFTGDIYGISTTNSGETNNWSPYKEFVICIKK